MGILANAMGEHLAQCAAAGYNAASEARCPFIPPCANDAWCIGRYLRESDQRLPGSVRALGGGRYEVNGQVVTLDQNGKVRLAH